MILSDVKNIHVKKNKHLEAFEQLSRNCILWNIISIFMTPQLKGEIWKGWLQRGGGVKLIYPF